LVPAWEVILPVSLPNTSLVRLSSLFNHSSVQTTRIYLSLRQEEIQNLYMLQDMFVY
jgi:hypothetical protein